MNLVPALLRVKDLAPAIRLRSKHQQMTAGPIRIEPYLHPLGICPSIHDAHRFRGMVAKARLWPRRIVFDICSAPPNRIARLSGPGAKPREGVPRTPAVTVVPACAGRQHDDGFGPSKRLQISVIKWLKPCVSSTVLYSARVAASFEMPWTDTSKMRI